MATTAAEVCNVALSRIGQRELIDSLDEDTEAARACAVAFPHALEGALAAGAWRFATSRAALALLPGLTGRFYAYAYALPSDCIAPRYLDSGFGPSYGGGLGGAYGAGVPAELVGVALPGSLAGARVPFVTEGGVLYTSDAAAVLVYTARVDSPARWPPLFTDFMAWKLAAELALSVALKPQLAMALDQRASQAFARALAADLNQAQEGPPPDSEFIRVR